ncbi:MAG TPA: prepilin-type N-terminal cleavage/methylation domain-containing protein, partial [Gemmatimonadaceae bacterium]|nr:prepilin-type N-terminal cleavage/methylation domain-containing protein [Gemmatimonadaceae bacterium]
MTISELEIRSALAPTLPCPCSASHVSPVRKHDRSRHVPDPGGSLMRVNTKKGFTLIELLIVIVIIG